MARARCQLSAKSLRRKQPMDTEAGVVVRTFRSWLCFSIEVRAGFTLSSLAVRETYKRCVFDGRCGRRHWTWVLHASPGWGDWRHEHRMCLLPAGLVCPGRYLGRNARNGTAPLTMGRDASFLQRELTETCLVGSERRLGYARGSLRGMGRMKKTRSLVFHRVFQSGTMATLS